MGAPRAGSKSQSASLDFSKNCFIFLKQGIRLEIRLTLILSDRNGTTSNLLLILSHFVFDIVKMLV